MIINTSSTGPPTKKLKMQIHAAGLFEANIAEELALSAVVDTTTDDLSAEINSLEVTIAKFDAELREASINRSTEAATFEREAIILNNVAEQDGEIFEEYWSLDAAIASKELHDLRLREQQAIEEYDTEEADTAKGKLEATSTRNALVHTLEAYTTDHPETDAVPPPDNKIRKQHKAALH